MFSPALPRSTAGSDSPTPAGLLLLLRLLALLLLFAPGPTAAQDSTGLREDQIKALFIFNFTRYVEWPAGAPSESHGFVIGVAGESAVEEELRRITAGKDVGGVPISVRAIRSTEDLRDCRIAYLSAGLPAASVKLLLRAAENEPILTVGETAEFAEAGGIVRFVPRSRKVGLVVNLAQADRAGIKISSKLLAVAEISFHVRPEETERL